LGGNNSWTTHSICVKLLHKHDKLTQCCRAFTLALARLSCLPCTAVNYLCCQHTESAKLQGEFAGVVKPEQLSVHTSCMEAWGVWPTDGLEFLPDEHQLHGVVAVSDWQPDDARPHNIQRAAWLVDWLHNRQCYVCAGWIQAYCVKMCNDLCSGRQTIAERYKNQ